MLIFATLLVFHIYKLLKLVFLHLLTQYYLYKILVRLIDQFYRRFYQKQRWF